MEAKLTLFIALLLITNYSYSQYDNYGNGSNSSLSENPTSILNESVGSIVHVIPSGLSLTNGITSVNNSLWITSTNNALYKLSSIDGEIQKTLDIDIQYSTGITFVSPNLYVVDKNNRRICKIDTTNGNIIDFFYTPESNINAFSSGLTWDGNSLWYNCGGDVDSTYNLDLTGQVISKHKAFGGTPTGLTFDGTNLWSINTSSDLIYKIALPNFTLIDSINAPGGDFPNGLAFDGQYLWVSNNASDSIYQLDIGMPSNIISNEIGNDIISVWPNPAADFINIEMPNMITSTKVFQISNVQGQIVKEIYINENDLSNTYRIDVSSIKPGVYILNAIINDKTLGTGLIIK